MNTPASPLIDWHALAQVLLTSVATGLGLVVLFCVGIYSISLSRRGDSTVTLRTFNRVAVVAIGLVIIATAVWGFIVIVSK